MTLNKLLYEVRKRYQPHKIQMKHYGITKPNLNKLQKQFGGCQVTSIIEAENRIFKPHIEYLKIYIIGNKRQVINILIKKHDDHTMNILGDILKSIHKEIK